MADLPTNYYDDILSASMNGKKKYKLTYRNGTTEEVTIEDISEYDQYGSKFGAGDINKTNHAVNEKFDSGDVVDPMLTTEPGFAADAYQTKLQFDAQNKNLSALGGFTPVIDETGKITGYKTSVGGADTVFPFSSDLSLIQTDKYNTGKSAGTNTRQITLTSDINSGLILVTCIAVKDGSSASASSFSLKSSNANSNFTNVNKVTHSYNHGSSYAYALIITLIKAENLKSGDVLTLSAYTGESASFITQIFA